MPKSTKNKTTFKAVKIRIPHDDCDTINVINGIAAALKKFDISIIDEAEEGVDAIDILLTNQPLQPDDKKWGDDNG